MHGPRISAPSDGTSGDPGGSARQPERALVFVYGSLKRGFRNHAELAGATFEGPARTAAAYRLVVMGEYPALAPGDRSIEGELYGVTPALLEHLDEFEGEEYARRALELADGRSAEAYFATELALDCATPVDADSWRELP